MSALSQLADGDYSARLLLAPTKITRPFLNYPTKDSATKLFERWYEIDRASYTPFAAGATLPADSTADAADLAAYILEESEPELEPDGTQRVRCLFGHIPPQQTVVTSVRLTKPAIDGTFPQVYGAFRIFQPDTTLRRYDAYAAQDVQSDSGAPGFYPTGGTYTLSFGGSTTGSLNYNDSAGTVQTALNALTPVSNRGSVAVSGTYNSAGGLVIAFNAYAQITIATGSLTGGTVVKNENKTDGGYSQVVGATLAPVKETISIDTSSLIKSAGSWVVQTDYADGTNPLLSDLSRVSITPAGGYYYITGGTWTLTIGAYTTAAIPYDADLADIQEAIDLVAPGLYRIAAWDTFPAGQGYYDSGYNSLIIFGVYFQGGAVTGGTFTLTVGADTTGAIAYNASAATVETALDALTTVSNRGGCSVSGSLTAGFTITFANAAITANSASLTPTGALATPSITDGAIGRQQKVVFSNNSVVRDLAIPAHGITTADVLYLKKSGEDTYAAGVSNFTVPNANTIRLNLSPSQAYASWTTIEECGRRTKQSYTPGVATVPGRRITDYYYPGVSSGITTDDDIPIPLNQSDGVPLLEAIFAGSGTINWEVGDLEIYHGPVRRLTKVTIAAADV